MAFKHNSELHKPEISWSKVDKTKLPNLAFAYIGDPDKKSERKYPHHWVIDGKLDKKKDIYIDGTLYLHEGGLHAAWAAAMGARSGKKAPADVISHLQDHRNDLKENEEKEEDVLKQENIVKVINTVYYLHDALKGLHNINEIKSYAESQGVENLKPIAQDLLGLGSVITDEIESTCENLNNIKEQMLEKIDNYLTDLDWALLDLGCEFIFEYDDISTSEKLNEITNKINIFIASLK